MSICGMQSFHAPHCSLHLLRPPPQRLAPVRTRPREALLAQRVRSWRMFGLEARRPAPAGLRERPQLGPVEQRDTGGPRLRQQLPKVPQVLEHSSSLFLIHVLGLYSFSRS